MPRMQLQLVYAQSPHKETPPGPFVRTGKTLFVSVSSMFLFLLAAAVAGSYGSPKGYSSRKCSTTFMPPGQRPTSELRTITATAMPTCICIPAWSSTWAPVFSSNSSRHRRPSSLHIATSTHGKPSMSLTLSGITIKPDNASSFSQIKVVSVY